MSLPPYEIVDVPADEENRELCRRAQAGDLEARNEAVSRNMPLVIRMAGNRSRWAELEDLTQEGVLGLIRAVETYDPSFGVPFAAHAITHIRSYLQRCRQRQSGICLPSWTWSTSAVVKKRCAASKVYAAKYAETMADAKRVRAGVGQMGLALGDKLASRSPDPADVAEGRDEIAAVLRRVDSLDDREREVIRRRYGLGGPAETQAAIGQSHGHSREWTQRVEGKAMDRLRRLISESA